MESIVDLHCYQRRWFKDRSRFKIGMFARQTGKTFITCLEIVDDCFEAMAAGRRTRWVILSRGERQAKEAMEEGVKPFTKAYYELFRAVVEGEPRFHEYDFRIGEASYRALEIEFPDGTRITAIPANPDTARGFSANVFLDEFAIHKDSREIWKALFPVVSAGYKLRVTSTPKGKGNKFYELMTGNDDTWSRHQVDIHAAVADGLPRNIEELRAGINDDEAWEQEYELQWLDEAAAWLSYDLICAAEDPAAGDPQGYTGGPCFVGNDIAARGDLWVAWVWELVGDVKWTREIVVLKRVKFAEHDTAMDDIFKRYRVVRLAMDQTGMGEKPVEDAKHRYGDSRVEGVLFTAAAKLDLAIAGKQAFEDRKARIPEGDLVLRADLHKLQKVVGPTGIPRLVAERDGAGHADRTWAAFLGIAAAETGARDYDYTPATPRRGKFDTVSDYDDDDDDARVGSGLGGMRGAW